GIPAVRCGRAEGGSRIRRPLILSHFLLPATGLVLWIIYLASDSDTVAWIAFALLLVVALLGFTMLGIWLRQRQGRAGAVDAAVAARPPEQHFPVLIVLAHGLPAATTLVLVLPAAAGGGWILGRPQVRCARAGRVAQLGRAAGS